MTSISKKGVIALMKPISAPFYGSGDLGATVRKFFEIIFLVFEDRRGQIPMIMRICPAENYSAGAILVTLQRLQYPCLVTR